MRQLAIFTSCSILSVEEVVRALNTDLHEGLSARSVQDSVLLHGKNVLTPPRQLPLVFLGFLRELFVGFGWLMWVAAIGTALAYQPIGRCLMAARAGAYALRLL
jgi:hypothetical protein